MAVVIGTPGDEVLNGLPGMDNTVSGLGGNDTLGGFGLNDTLDGGEGGDLLLGRNGFDDLRGGLGDDTLSGGNGGDRLDGGLGNNALTGGNGDDTFVFDMGNPGVASNTITDFDATRINGNMVYDDVIEIADVCGRDVTFVQAGDRVEIYVGVDQIADIQGSQGPLSAADVMAATVFTGVGPGAVSIGSVPVAAAPVLCAVRIDGIDASDISGVSVASVGDIDADGFDDVLISASAASPNGVFGAGETYLVYGSAIVASGGGLELSTLTAAQGVVINGIDASDASGSVIASAGDVNGDGINDVMIGAQYADPDGAASAGETYVVFGTALASGIGTLDLAAMTAAQGVLVKGVDNSDLSGAAVSSAGDVDGDGLDDILIGAYGAYPGFISYVGETYLVYGAALAASGGVVDLASLGAAQGVVFEGIDSSDYSGRSVSSAGDVDGDGKDDIVISAYLAAPDGRSAAGETYVVYASAITSSGGFVDLDTLTASQGVLIKGANPGDQSGHTVSDAGDVDGDGVGDVLISAPLADPDGAQSAGQTYLIYGTAFGSSGGALDLATLSAAQGVVIKGIDAGDVSGVSVSSAGDVDGDGLDDILIGATNADPDGVSNAGEVYLVYGEALTASGGVIDLATLSPAQGVLIKGVDHTDVAGSAVSSAGDVNGDGLDDILISAYLGDPGGVTNAGETYVLSGALLTAEKLDDGILDLADPGLFI